ncbi:hypothetical protein [Streptomyces sp. NRRL S-237]|nr:hypothetical protein [Streptomyces sp. NRRL S-237]
MMTPAGGSAVDPKSTRNTGSGSGTSPLPPTRQPGVQVDLDPP